jgi:hypothetical protein
MVRVRNCGGISCLHGVNQWHRPIGLAKRTHETGWQTVGQRLGDRLLYRRTMARRGHGQRSYTATVALALTDHEPERFGEPYMGLVIRIDRHSDDPDDYIDEAWNQLYEKVAHGGDAGDELAALLSLAVGIRPRAGGISPVFRSNDPDDRGYPHQVEHAAPIFRNRPCGPCSLTP